MDNSDAMPDPYLDELDVRLDAIELETRLKAVQREKQMRTLEPPQGIIDWAIRVSVLSPCRSKRGVVIWRENATPIDRSISAGYNRPPQGFACDGSLECKSNCSDAKKIKKTKIKIKKKHKHKKKKKTNKKNKNI